MSDERITVEQIVAEAVAPFVETVGDAAEAATAVLEALREVTEGDGIWWCERHQCRWGYAPNCGWSPRDGACRGSRRLLIEWEAE